MKQLLLFLLLTTSFIFSADEPSFLIRFRDKPGIYKIKVEMVKNVKINDSSDTYDTISSISEYYEQENEVESYVLPYITIPQGAEFLRLSIRSGEKFTRGWRHYFSVSE